MRIAFDLDDLLIPGRVPFAVEPRPRGLLARWLCSEPLREGTARLFRALRQLGHEIWIYTTSLRSPWKVRLMFWAYGAPVGRVVNENLHRRALAHLDETYKMCTKYPPAFGIDVLIDDSEGVLIEAKRYGFSVIVVSPDDTQWLTTLARQLGVRQL